ncbi:transposase [Streptomyces jietaisiensis]
MRDLLPVPGWLAGRGGRPEGYCHRQMIDAVRHLVDNGIRWRAMPSDFPPWPRLYAFFTRWMCSGSASRAACALRVQSICQGGPMNPSPVNDPAPCAPPCAVYRTPLPGALWPLRHRHNRMRLGLRGR